MQVVIVWSEQSLLPCVVPALGPESWLTLNLLYEEEGCKGKPDFTLTQYEVHLWMLVCTHPVCMS